MIRRKSADFIKAREINLFLIKEAGYMNAIVLIIELFIILYLQNRLGPYMRYVLMVPVPFLRMLPWKWGKSRDY